MGKEAMQVTLDELKAEASQPQARLRLVYSLVLSAMMIEVAALAIGSVLGMSAGEYWSFTKIVRDGAAAGSGELSQIWTITAVSTWLEPFRFVGVALFFAGIAAALWAVVPRIQLRANALAMVIPAVTGKAKKQG